MIDPEEILRKYVSLAYAFIWYLGILLIVYTNIDCYLPVIFMTILTCTRSSKQTQKNTHFNCTTPPGNNFLINNYRNNTTYFSKNLISKYSTSSITATSHKRRQSHFHRSIQLNTNAPTLHYLPVARTRPTPPRLRDNNSILPSSHYRTSTIKKDLEGINCLHLLAPYLAYSGTAYLLLTVKQIGTITTLAKIIFIPVILAYTILIASFSILAIGTLTLHAIYLTTKIRNTLLKPTPYLIALITTLLMHFLR